MRADRDTTLCRTIAGLLLCVSVSLVACASGHRADASGPVASIPAGSYQEAFRAAKDVLRASHFDLARVDAAAGVITTRPRSSAGLATPWLDYDETFGAAVDDLIHRDRRRAEIRFGPAGEQEASALVDRRAIEGPIEMRVRVEVERTYVTGRRADPTSIRLMSREVDPELAERGLYPLARGVVGRDEALASRIARMIEDSIRAEGGS